MVERSLSFATSVEILVGSEKKSFLVPSYLLTKRSAYFEAQLSSANDKDCKTIELLNLDPDIFDLYLQCVYENSAYAVIEGTFDDEEDEIVYDERVMRRLVKAWCIADHLQDMMSCNIIMRTILTTCKGFGSYPRHKTIRIAYANTAPGSKLRALMVDYSVHHVFEGAVERCGAELPRDFLTNFAAEKPVVRRLKSRHEEDDTWERRREPIRKGSCFYHQHDESHKECYVHDP